MKRAALVIASLALAACTADVYTPRPKLEPHPLDPTNPENPAAPGVKKVTIPIADARAQVPAAEALAFARSVAPMLVGRALTPAERSELDAGGAVALRTMLERWVEEPAFAETARDFISVKLKASGASANLDGSLPGNLAAYLVKNKRPHAELITSPVCRDRMGTAIACDSGAPFGAGVLTTRVFLANNAGRFNLKRARTVLMTFACSDYPLTQALQPSLQRAQLIELFQNDKPPDGTSGAFGNGHACYTCHSQFGAHAQPFVKFDSDGRWQADATGLQLPGGEQGRSTGKLFTSHMADEAAAKSEASQYFGQPVADLAGEAKVLSEHPLYLECAVRSVFGYVLSLSGSEANALPYDVISEIVSEAKSREPEPSFARLVVEAFSHPSVVAAKRSP
ncbi:MAG: hypothetical protein JNK82_01185 [Myxococcaceae bacterium]|nr:hypothetical protein [Myxococcaceae bacterium]